MENNKKTWLVVLVVLAVGAAVAVGLTMGGKLFKGNIGGGPGTCEEGAKGCVTTCEEGAKGCPTSGPVSGPTSGPVTSPAWPKGQEPITRGEWTVYLVRTAPNIDKTELSNCTESSFSDTQGHKYEKYICYAAKKEWVKGYADGTFKPSNYVTRAEGAKVITVVFDIMWKNTKAQAVDYDNTVWFFDYANTLIRYKFPNALSNCSGGACGGKAEFFHGGELLTKVDAEKWVKHGKIVKKSPVATPVVADNIDRVNFVRLLVTGAGYSNAEVEKCTTNTFSDLKTGSIEAKFACKAYEIGIIKGSADGTFGSKKLVNRAEGIKMVVNAFGLEIAGPVLGCSDVKYGVDWFADYFEIAQSNAFPSMNDANGKCNPSANLTNTDAKSWINYAKTL